MSQHVWRAALDLDPIDVVNSVLTASLETLVWTEQTERLARTPARHHRDRRRASLKATCVPI